jgi:glucokinase
VREDLSVHDERTVSSRDVTQDELLALLGDEIRAVLTEQTAAIGVSCASTIDRERDTLVWTGTLPLGGFALRAHLEKAFGVPAVVENDGNAAAVGEHRTGAGVGTSDLVLLTVGTGLGGGVVLNGRLRRGANGVAGELGHFSIDPRGPRCVEGCAGVGHGEVLASGTTLDAAARAAAERHPESGLGRRAAAGEPVDGPAAVELAQAGDPVARAAVLRIGRNLGRAACTLVTILDPELIVLSGGAAAADELLLEPMRRMVRKRCLEPARDRVRIELGRLGEHAGLVGAAVLALEGTG